MGQAAFISCCLMCSSHKKKLQFGSQQGGFQPWKAISIPCMSHLHFLLLFLLPKIIFLLHVPFGSTLGFLLFFSLHSLDIFFPFQSLSLLIYISFGIVHRTPCSSLSFELKSPSNISFFAVFQLQLILFSYRLESSSLVRSFCIFIYVCCHSYFFRLALPFPLPLLFFFPVSQFCLALRHLFLIL